MNKPNKMQCDCYIGIDRMMNEGFILYDTPPIKSEIANQHKREEEHTYD